MISESEAPPRKFHTISPSPRCLSNPCHLNLTPFFLSDDSLIPGPIEIHTILPRPTQSLHLSCHLGRNRLLQQYSTLAADNRKNLAICYRRMMLSNNIVSFGAAPARTGR